MGQGEEYDGALRRCYVLVGTIDRPAARKRGARRGSRSGPRDHNGERWRLSLFDHPRGIGRLTLRMKQLLIILISLLGWSTSSCVSPAQRIWQNQRRNFEIYFLNTDIRPCNISGFCSDLIFRMGERPCRCRRLRSWLA